MAVTLNIGFLMIYFIAAEMSRDSKWRIQIFFFQLVCACDGMDKVTVGNR